MCRILVRDWSNLKSTVAATMLKGKFPDCGIKYTTRHGEGLVLVKHDVPGVELIKQKAKAAALNSDLSHVFVIPISIAKAAGI